MIEILFGIILLPFALVAGIFSIGCVWAIIASLVKGIADAAGRKL